MTNTEGDANEEPDVPDAFVAVAVKVYDIPFVRPITKIGLDKPDAVIPPGDEVTVYETAYNDEVNEIYADPEEGTPARFVGVAGIGLTNTKGDANEEPDVPIEFDAVAVNV